jgi:uncharacterized membrane protein required for colicin V production
MSKVDIFLVCILFLGAWLGYRWGIVFMIFTAIALVAGIWFITTYKRVAEVEAIVEQHGKIVYVAGCIVVLLLALLAGKIASWFAEKILQLVLLNWVNKGIGAFVGLVAVTIFLAFVVRMAAHMPVYDPMIKPKQLQESAMLRFFDRAGSYLPGLGTLSRLSQQDDYIPDLY